MNQLDDWTTAQYSCMMKSAYDLHDT